MKKIFTCLFMALLCIAGKISAQYYTLPVCSTLGSNTYGPMNSTATANSTNRTAVIYPIDKLTPLGGSTITGVYFNRITASGSMAGTPNFKIYMKEVNFIEWPTGALDWAGATTGATLVYDGNPATIVGADAGWKNFPLSSAFNYTGTQNLAIFFEYTNPTASTTITWNYEYLAPCINTNTNDATKYANNTTGTLATSLSSTEAFRRPAIAFDATLTCYPPTSISLSNTTTTGTTVNWVAPASPPASGYEVYYNTTGVAPIPSTSPIGTTIAGDVDIDLSGLTAGVTTYFWVRSACSSSEKSPWSAVYEINVLPVNDECSDAIPITPSPNSDCISISGTTYGATSSSSETAPGCSATGINDDVWYSFVATGTSHTVSVTGTSSTLALAVYSGNCGALVAVSCASTNNQLNNLTIGETYYVRVYTTSTVATTFSNFNICIISPPVNDNCDGAILIPATTSFTCSSPTAGSTLGSTASGTLPVPTCSATGVNDDVWFSFVAVSSIHTVTLSNVSSTSAIALYSGTCGGLVQVGCASTTLTVSGLSVGATYYARVYTTTATATTTSTFDICVTAPPVNDECGGAPSMPVTAFGATCSATAVSTAGATISTTTGQANTCTTTGINDDVWFTFTSTVAGTYDFSYSDLVAVTGTASTVGMNVYTGSCGALTAVTNACSSGFGTGGSGTYSVILAAATSYTLRLYVGSTANSGTFNFCITAPVPAPANDNCAGAISLPTPSTGNTCSNAVSGTTEGATQSPDTAPTCSATGINDDVWYSFTATSTAHTVVISNATNTTAAAIYSGSCGSLTQIANACNTGGSSASGLSVGTVYYVRVYTTVSTAATNSNFDICVVTGTPVNDECTGAISLTPSPSLSCTNAVAGNTEGATNSNDVAPSCSATGINDDVWYSFVATSNNHTVLLSNVSSVTAAAIYSGNCGSLVQVAGACGTSTDATTIASTLTIGATYYVRVFTTSAVVGTYGTFDICVLSGTPANDDCGGAIDIPVSTDNSCTNALTGSTIGATATTGETAPTCSATGANDDVWYSFVATQTTHTLNIFNSTVTTAAAVYSGTCGALVQIGCNTSNQVLSALTVGNTYYVRVYSTSAVVGFYSNFSICIGVIPTNDNCAGALPLTASAGNNCNTVFGSTVGATATAGETATTCSSTGTNDDVWYSFVAAATTQTVSILNATNTTAASIYSGSCGALTLVNCASTTATATGLTIGQTYYVRVYTTSSTTTIYSSFDICVTGPPANDECANAVTLTNNVPVNGSNANASASMGITSCTGTATASNDVWYQFTAVSNGDAVISVTNVGPALDAVVFAYSGSCGSLTSIGCADGPADGGSEVLPLTGLVAGQTYYIRVFGFAAADIGPFTITVSGAALPVLVDYFKGNKQGEANRLSWKLSCTGSGNTSIVLERSLNNQSGFTGIHSESVYAARCNQQFLYNDQDALSGVAYYRLKITDEAGKVTYSNIIALRADKKQLQIVGIAPNPVIDNKVTLSITSAKAARIELIIRDVAGRTLQSKTADLLEGSNQVAFSLKPMAAGVYYLTGRSSNGELQTIRFVKQ